MPSKTKGKTTTPRTQSKLNFGATSRGINPTTPTAKKQGGNGNILSFFKKIDVEEQLFCDGSPSVALSTTTATTNPYESGHEDIYGVEDDDLQCEETQNSSKRRKLSVDDENDGIEPECGKQKLKADHQGKPRPAKRPARGKGPFLEDSDSEEEDLQGEDTKPSPHSESPKKLDITSKAFIPTTLPDTTNAKFKQEEQEALDSPSIPGMKQDYPYNGFKDLDDMDALFDDDEFEGGEEFRERRYMEEQARLEDEDGLSGITESCPLCNASLAGITSEQATVHVNGCLDGNPVPLPAHPAGPAPSDVTDVDASAVGKRFSRAAVPKPGQTNPIALGSTDGKQTSAFSKLMSGHAEDAAWASAAAAEHASRGKQAYQRTCPFYKIMPGLSICVDAFRYGAVEGCNAYFLSHFHSDHYIGLTSSWSHGPIYCSQVTASLIRNQLRTDAKWLRPLEFEERVEVPGTPGVFVTMVPANHCPGSSLFLFEKAMSKGSTSRTQRILHCGDFRACPAHVAHPLLRPDLVDAVSGKIKQQKIDICYLDTTYLNPRYSFPPQNDVIRACAEFCKSLSADSGVADDVFATARRERGTIAVTKFFQKESEDDSASKKTAQPTTEATGEAKAKKDRILVICGTYSIGKERICKAIAQALNTKIFASPAKIKICKQLGDPELTALMTSNPIEAQVHMQMLMEIRAETLQDYLDGYKPHFTRIVGFRPSGWSFRSGTGKSTTAAAPANASPSTVPTTQILHGPGWRTRFSSDDLVAQRGSNREAMCFGVPYSEHSSFRELALFIMALRIEKVIPTVNVGSEPSRRRMKSWLDRWSAERRKGGIIQVLLENEDDLDDGALGKTDQGGAKRVNGSRESPALWEGKGGGGGVWW